MSPEPKLRAELPLGDKSRLEDELGDVLFTVAILAETGSTLSDLDLAAR